MRSIALANSDLVAWVDDQDYERASAYRWSAFRPKRNRKIYARTTTRVAGKRKTVLLHQVVLQFASTRQAPIDHINTDGLDNRKQNLRLATNGANQVNRERRKDNSSGVTGVFQRKTGSGRWTAFINKGGKRKQLGEFSSREEAIDARIRAEAELYGDFAFKGHASDR